MNNKIKILHVIGKRPKGGVGTFLINMHSNIDRSKIQFDYLINAPTPDGIFDIKVKALGGKVFVLPELRYKNIFKYLKELVHFFRENHDYKIIHVHSVNIAVFNFIIAKKYGIMYRIAHSHSVKYSDKVINSIRNFFLQLPVKRLANSYFACSIEAGVFLFGRKNVEENKVFIAKNAIEPMKFRYDNSIRERVRKKMLIDGKMVIGHVGAFLPVKNHSYLIDIFKEVYKKNNQAILILVGYGELEEEIKNKVNKLNLDKAVMFMGFRDDVYELMQVFDVFILPSLFEGLPLVGIEAQAAGLPCIFSETITQEVKITDLVVFKSIKAPPQEWADQIFECETHVQRSDTLSCIIEGGFEVRSVAEKLQRIYLDLK